MIEPYLKKQDREEETSTLEAAFELAGETIKDVLPINKEKYMLLMESGNSLIAHTAGAFTIHTKDRTKSILKELVANSQKISITHDKSIRALELYKENSSEKKADSKIEQNNEQNKTGGEQA